MAKNKVVLEKVQIKDVYFDFDGVIEKALSRGVLKTNKSIANEIGYTGVGFEKLKGKAPKIVGALYHFLKANHLRIEDVVKECQGQK